MSPPTNDGTNDPTPSPPPPLDTAQLPAKRKIACLACRTIKLRCLFAAPEAGALDPCRRCKRLELACVYQPKRRPVKVKDGKDGQEHEPDQEVGRTQSPFEEMSHEQGRESHQSSSRTPYVNHGMPPAKRRRLPGSDPSFSGDGYPSFLPTMGEAGANVGYEYDGYAGRIHHGMMVGDGNDSGMMPINSSRQEDRKFVPSDLDSLIPVDPAIDSFRSRGPQMYLDPQQQRNWPIMYEQQQLHVPHQMINHPQQTQQHRHSLPHVARTPAVIPQDYAAFTGPGPTGTPGSGTDGSVGTAATGTGLVSSQRPASGPQKGKILYTQPLSISPNGGAPGHAPVQSARNDPHHGLPPAPPPLPPPAPTTATTTTTQQQIQPHQVAHPQMAPKYREYGSYLSYERDVHDVGAGPIGISGGEEESGEEFKISVGVADNGRIDGFPSGRVNRDERDPHDVRGSTADQRAMRNSMALTSILDDMKKDLRAPVMSSERERHHHHHNHQQQQGIDRSSSDPEVQRPHSASYVSQEESLEARRDHSDDVGPGGGREMDIGERYNALDIAERERTLGSALDVGNGGGPVRIGLVEDSGPGGGGAGGQNEHVNGKGRTGQHLLVPGQQHYPSALASTSNKRSARGRVGIVDDELRARQREREYQRLESERMEGMEDPVTLGILDEDDVAFLFECFHEKFNAYIAILDPALHTPHYVLKTCSLLHTAICTVTAQTYAPEQYKVLLKRANFMLGKAFERGDQAIGIVQALSILSCWKEPHDKGGWLRLGYAIRMGYELGLDQPPQRPLPKDRLKALEVLNRERTWFQLAAFDRSMHSIFGRRQRMIRTETQHWIENWITDHPEVYCYADGMLAASYPTGEMIINLRQSTPSYMEDDVGFRVMLHRTKMDIASWRERWFGEQPLAFLHPISAAIIGFYAVASDWEVADFCYRNVPKSRIPEHLADATSKAMKLLRYIVTDLAPGEIMVFAPDVITVRAARSAVFLTRLVPQLEPTVVEEIYTIFRDVVRECRRHSRGQNTTYHLAKFFASLIKISSVGPTRSASRIQTPDEGSQEQQAVAVSGEALTAKLNEAAEGTAVDQDAAPQDFFQNDESLFVFDDSVDPLSIDALLQESQDWFSADLMAQINSDGGWNPLPVFPLPDNFHML